MKPWALGVFLWALGGVSSVRAAPIDENIETLRKRPTGMDVDAWKKARREIAGELGEVRSEQAVTALIEIVDTERYDAVLSIAIESLAKQGDPRAIPSLQRVYADRSIDTFVREEARKAIEALGGTPQDDARLVGSAAVAGGAATGQLSGPQLGTMGEASVEADQLGPAPTVAPLPTSVRTRDRDIAFVLGDLSLGVNAPLRSAGAGRDVGNPVLADVGLGALASYVDERHRWGWSAEGLLTGNLRNGDLTSAPAGDGDDDGDTLYIRQGLSGSAEAHLYFGKTDVHAFAAVGLDERVSHANIEDLDGTGPDEGELTDTRFALDVVPAGGFGWGRYLNAAADVQIDAIVAALTAENILSKPLDGPTKRRIQEALYRHAHEFSTYPRLARVLGILQAGGFLARRPGPRLVHRLRSILEDPSYFSRMRGILVRAGFLYGAALLQDDYFRRQGDHLGAPYLQFQSGFQIDRERQIGGDLRFWYDVIGPLQGFTTDAGARYTRFLHGRYDDYRGHWFAGARGGVSQRQYRDDADGDGDPDDDNLNLGYRAVLEGGYAFGFRRGSEIAIEGHAGVDSGRFIAGAGLALRFGLVRSSVSLPP